MDGATKPGKSNYGSTSTSNATPNVGEGGESSQNVLSRVSREGELGLETTETDETSDLLQDDTDTQWDSSSVDGGARLCGDSAAKVKARLRLMVIFIITILLGPLNFVMYKVAYAAYGKGNEFFVSNMVNFQYVIFGQGVLWWAQHKGQISPELNNWKVHGKIRVMALLDALSGFLAAMGAVYTTGAMQQLLNQSLIPFTMLAGWAFLGKYPAWKQVGGAVVIFLGAFVVLLPHILAASSSSSSGDGDGDSASDSMRTMGIVAACVYASSNIPMSVAYTYKESAFKNMQVHVVYLTQWVSIYQLLWGFCLLPLQTIPGLGSKDGLTMSQSLHSLQTGWKCFLHEDPICADNHAAWLLTSYILVNFAFNLMGLYLVKHGSSVLNAISYAIILPLTVISFTFPMLGVYREEFNWDTLAGLAVVMCGFFIWRSSSIAESQKGEADEDVDMDLDTPVDTPGSTPSGTPVLHAYAAALGGAGSGAGSGANYPAAVSTPGSAIALKDRCVRTGSNVGAGAGAGAGATPGTRKKRARSKHLFSPKASHISDSDAPAFQERTIVLAPLSMQGQYRYKQRTLRSHHSADNLLSMAAQASSLPKHSHGDLVGSSRV